MTKNIQGILIILHTFIVSLIFYGHNSFASCKRNRTCMLKCLRINNGSINLL